MKIIDEKGRLFGKINLIDLLVILVIVIAAAALLWKFGGKRATEAVTAKPKTATFTIVAQDVPEEVCRFAETQVGQQLTNSDKLINATVVSTAYKTVEGQKNPDLYIVVEADVSYASYVYKVGTQEVRVGFDYIVKTSEFEMTGTVCNLEVTDG